VEIKSTNMDYIHICCGKLSAHSDRLDNWLSVPSMNRIILLGGSPTVVLCQPKIALLSPSEGTAAEAYN
jgi:hypothetical protein